MTVLSYFPRRSPSRLSAVSGRCRGQRPSIHHSTITKPSASLSRSQRPRAWSYPGRTRRKVEVWKRRCAGEACRHYVQRRLEVRGEAPDEVRAPPAHRRERLDRRLARGHPEVAVTLDDLERARLDLELRLRGTLCAAVAVIAPAVVGA